MLEGQTLFFLVSTLLGYKLIEMFAIGYKVELAILRAEKIGGDGVQSLGWKRAVLGLGTKARGFCHEVSALRAMHEDFFTVAQAIVLSVLAALGYMALLLEPPEQNEHWNTLIVAAVTLVVSVVLASVNLLAERVRTTAEQVLDG